MKQRSLLRSLGKLSLQLLHVVLTSPVIVIGYLSGWTAASFWAGFIWANNHAEKIHRHG